MNNWHFDFAEILVLVSYVIFCVLVFIGKINGVQFIIGVAVSTVIGLVADLVVDKLEED